jgi:hypothetical protein
MGYLVGVIPPSETLPLDGTDWILFSGRVHSKGLAVHRRRHTLEREPVNKAVTTRRVRDDREVPRQRTSLP